MKFARFDGGRTGLVVERRAKWFVVDVAASLPALGRFDGRAAQALSAALGPAGNGSWVPLIESWRQIEEHLEALLGAAENGADGIVERELGMVRLEAPLPSPCVRTFALGGNFGEFFVAAAKRRDEASDPDDVLRKRREEGPWGFLVLPETVVGPDDAVTPPRGLVKLDYEAEVAVVLQRGGRSLKPPEVSVWGFTAWNDFTLQDGLLGIGPTYDRGSLNWALQKNFDSGSSCGPWVVVGEPYDVDALRVALRVNGDLRQQGSTSEMIFSFAEAAEHISHFLTLRPGDMIASGTPMGNALGSGIDGPYLGDGDVTEVEVEGVGTLRNRIAAPAAA